MMKQGQSLHERLSDEFIRRRSRLRVDPDPDRVRRDKVQRARALAGHAIDGALDLSASSVSKSARKDHLLDGPDEFREDRIDQPK
jgi:hypothetical protein